VYTNSLNNFKTISLATTEIARVGGNYAVQGHSRSPILVPIESRLSISD